MLWHAFGVADHSLSELVLSFHMWLQESNLSGLGASTFTLRAPFLFFCLLGMVVLFICMSVYRVNVMPEEASRGLRILWSGN